MSEEEEEGFGWDSSCDQHVEELDNLESSRSLNRWVVNLEAQNHQQDVARYDQELDEFDWSQSLDPDLVVLDGHSVKYPGELRQEPAAAFSETHTSSAILTHCKALEQPPDVQDGASTSFGGSDALAKTHLDTRHDPSGILGSCTGSEEFANTKLVRQQQENPVQVIDLTSFTGLQRPGEALPELSDKPRASDTGTSNLHASNNRGTNAPVQKPEPPHVFQFKRTNASSCSSKRSWWSHKLYRGPSGVAVNLHYCPTREESENVAKLFANQPVLGFEMEWKAWPCKSKDCRKANCHGPQQKVSLIQLACEADIGLFHIAVHKGATADQLLAPTLKRIIESPSIVKTGVSIAQSDASRLRRVLHVQPWGLIELSDIYKLVNFWPWNKELAMASFSVSLATQVEEHLRLPLAKPQRFRASDWSKPLSRAQIEYAADDAYAGFMLFHVLENKRRRLADAPSRPAFADGTPPHGSKRTGTGVPSVKKRRRAGAAAAQLLPALYALRETICSNVRELCPVEPESVATEYTLRVLAEGRPCNEGDLGFIPGAQKLAKYSKQWNIDLIAYIQEHSTTVKASTTGASKVRKTRPESHQDNSDSWKSRVSRNSPDSKDAFQRQVTPTKVKRCRI